MEDRDPVHSTTGRSPLHLAAKYGHVDVVQIIIDKKMKNKDRKDAFGKTAFLYAAEYGHLAVCKQLKSKAKSRSEHGRTGLHLAAEGGHLNVCKFLIKIFEKKFHIDDYGNTPLHDAAKSGQLNICEWIFELAENDEDKNPLDKEGRTPFHLAAQKGQLDVLEFFNDMAPKDKNGKKPENYIQDLTVGYPRQFFEGCTRADRENLNTLKQVFQEKRKVDREVDDLNREISEKKKLADDLDRKSSEKKKLARRKKRMDEQEKQDRRLENASSTRPEPTPGLFDRGPYRRVR